MPSVAAKERNGAAVRRLFARGRPPPPSWAQPTAFCADGTLPPAMHMSHQLQLAHELDSQSPSPAAPRGDAGGASCYAMCRRVARHEWEMRETKDRRETRETKAAAAHEQAVLRYELSLPRRRAAGHHFELTAAQRGTRLPLPSAAAVDRLVARTGGRFVLENPHRQQLLRGEPVMTRIMRGEFYEPQRETRSAKDFTRANKRHVRVASEINCIMHSHRGAKGVEFIEQ